jgi:nucleotide-binding universal stress UspA family protein
MTRPLLVALDGSDFAEASLPLAAAIAHGSGAPVIVTVVHDPSAYIHLSSSDLAVPPHDPALLDGLAAGQRAYLDRVVATLTAAGLSARAERREGTVVEALSELAIEVDASLLLLTTHGRGGLERLWIGSVATSLLQRATLPLLLVRPASAPVPLASLPLSAADARAALVGPVLVPLDGSSLAEAVLPIAQQVAGALGVALSLFRVVEPQGVRMAPFGAEALLADDGALEAETEEAAEYLERLTHRFELATSTRQVVSDMSAARAIIDEVARQAPSVVAIATHGRSGLSRLLIGSVADKLLRALDRPLLVYRPRAN